MEKQYFTTYFNKNSVYNKDLVINDLDFMTSLGEEGSIKRSFGVKKTTITTKRKELDGNILDKLRHLVTNFKQLLEENNASKAEDLYYEFKIAKRTGGHRKITAPINELLKIQRDLVDVFRDDLKVLEHNSAHAYTKNRSIVTNAEVHKNNFNFVNIDLSNFFPSITKEVLISVLERLDGTADLMETLTLNEELMDDVFNIILYNGALPQGSATSPFFSNLIMIPFDYYMEELIKERRRDIVYTRYADDMTFSSKLKVQANYMLDFINSVKETAYPDIDFITVHPDKTRTTTNKGKNRVTGIKINADNNLSIGWREKQTLKSNMVSLIIAKLNKEPVDQEQVQQTVGMFSYLQSVEPGYAKYLLRNWSLKFKQKDIIRFLVVNE